MNNLNVQNPNDIQFSNANDQPRSTVACLQWLFESKSATKGQLENNQNSESKDFVASSWDNNVYLYRLTHNLQKAQQSYLNVDLFQMSKIQQWQCSSVVMQLEQNPNELNKLHLGDIEGSLCTLDLEKSNLNKSQLGKHEQKICSLSFIKEMNLLMSVGCEKEIKLWDVRTHKNVGSLKLCQPPQIADYEFPYLLIGYQKCNYELLDINQFILTDTASQSIQELSPFGIEQACLTCAKIQKFKNPSNGKYEYQYILGNDLGLVFVGGFSEHHVKQQCIETTTEKDADNISIAKLLQINAHYEQFGLNKLQCPVHSVGFNKRTANFVFSAGADNSIKYWRLDNPKLITQFNLHGPVTCASIDHSGKFMIYATGPSWKLRCPENRQMAQISTNNLFSISAHLITDDELQI